MKISDKALQELGFDNIQKEISTICSFQRSKDLALKLRPFKNKVAFKKELDCCSEILSFEIQGQSIPSFFVGEIEEGLAQLKIPEYQVSAEHFLGFADTASTLLRTQKFIKSRVDFFPNLHEKIGAISVEKFIIDQINNVFDKSGEVKSSASEELGRIRQLLASKKQEFNRLFQQALLKAGGSDSLAETKESIWDGKRVLAIKSEQKKFVKGRFQGISKTGKITYLEPEETIEVTNELRFLEAKEQNEIARILFQLSEDIRPFREDLISYHKLLSWLDLCCSKARLGKKIGGIFPNIDLKSCDIDLRNVYHPVLLMKSGKSNVVPQSLKLDQKNRFLVISGPNAGGKSISLKTIGLNQIMAQSAIPIPVDEGSKLGWFGEILTDIGDNQSIENELSTYSYRLKQIKHFLENANSKSLVLIDEFGSGSDPELGGALAEVCLKELYKRKSYAVITTHYGNIKVLVDQLPEARNASMIFDLKELSPTYKLSVGNAGSSFTFEVAEKLGLDKKILNQARQKVNRKKIELDESLAKAQAYESELKELKKKYAEATQIKSKATRDFEDRSEYYEKQYQQLQDLLQKSDKEISLGRRLKTYISTYPGPNKDGEWYETLVKYILKEQAKLKQELKSQKPKTPPKEEKTKKETEFSGHLLKRARKNKSEKPTEIAKPKEIKVGSKVSVLGSATKGRVTKIEGKKAFVEIGGFATKVALENLTAI
ncbi:endonuclease MutS2 [Luteibaculum oceani]|uniref:DNA mismatch repair proteins mutS family domain-containing protein n=1 Tax=Luteibaculum oceani TaxID=1294296 RepID=A0A5C6VA62_9FLAO|nr:hypothetical protein [Luteibaculum oceani]TXC82157.1 hypothetical protein FRX97_03420 [Luteibaculum oceani]